MIALLLAAFLPAAAFATCPNPNEPGGTSPEGTITYNSAQKTVQFCDGTEWWDTKGIAAYLPACSEGDGIVMSSAGWACSPGGPP